VTRGSLQNVGVGSPSRSGSRSGSRSRSRSRSGARSGSSIKWPPSRAGGATAVAMPLKASTSLSTVAFLPLRSFGGR
jgi:hypothetical protein